MRARPSPAPSEKGNSFPEKPEIVVFEILRDSVCSECGEELWKGRLLRMEDDRPFCMTCADLAHLIFVPRGDAAITRRASKYSTLRAVVVRFSRARRRYERQGILVEEAALSRAEQECLADDPARDRERERRAMRAAMLDAVALWIARSHGRIGV